MRKTEGKSYGRGLGISVVVGDLAGFVAILILFCIFASLVASGTLPENAMKYIAVGSALPGAFIGAVLAVKRHGSQVMTVGLCVGATMYLVTLIGAAFSTDGQIFGAMSAGNFLALLLGAVLGGFACMKRKKHRHA